MAIAVATKDPSDVDYRHVVWCSPDGSNDASAADCGDLQGATITASEWTVVNGTVIIDSDSTSSVTIKVAEGVAAVTFAINTVATAVVSGGADNETVVLNNKITTSDGRTLNQAITFEVQRSSD